MNLRQDAFGLDLARVFGSVCLILLIGLLDVAQAQPPSKSEPPSWASKVIAAGASAEIIQRFSPKLVLWQDAISKHAAGSQSSAWGTDQIQKAIETLEAVRSELRDFVSQHTPKLKEARAKLEKLGPPPKAGATESEELASQRKLISDEVGAYDGLIKRVEVLLVQAGQSIAAHNAARRSRFLRELLRRSDGLADVYFWRSLSGSMVPQINRAAELSGERLSRLGTSWPSVVLALALGLFTLFASLKLSHRVFRTNGLMSDQVLVPISRAARGAMVLRRALSVSVPVIASLLVLIAAGEALGIVRNEELTHLLKVIAYAAVAIFLISATHFALRPPHETERLIAVDLRSASAIHRIISVYVAVWFVDQVFELLDQFFQSSLSLIVLRISLAALLYATLLGSLLAIRLRRDSAHPLTSRTNGWPRWLFGLIALVAASIFAATLLGYVSLARFVGGQLVATGGLLFFVTLLHLTAEYVSSPRTEHEDESEAEQQTTMFGATLGVMLGIVLDVLMLLIGLPLLLLQWGFDWPEVRSWISSAIFGFQIGQLRISLLQIFIAIGIFLVGVVLTRLIREMFVRRTAQVFAPSTGARDSIAAIVGYAGIILSLVAALTYVGINLANLALIAGALSVGIGFGLQSIVNNFVSGLILLAERPVKVGDWIIIGDKQGRVQRISVRSTQIRSFDRSTLVVPNADLITNQVVNWDLGDSVGRVSINVGVSYNTDPRQVIDILMEIGRSHPGVLVYDRSPRVMFEAFGNSSLDFVLHVHLRNIKDFLDVQTDLRVAIVEAFRKAEIEIPYPQRDLHLRSSDIGQLEKVPEPGS